MPEYPVADAAGGLPGSPGPWWVVVPVKTGARAKSRLAVDPHLRARLARAFTLDTVSALGQCDRVAGVVAVVGGTGVGGIGDGGIGDGGIGVGGIGDGGIGDAEAVSALRGQGVRIVEEPAGTRGDLNAALRAGIAAVHDRLPGAPVALVLGDLPALKPRSVSRALDLALRARGSVFVADAAGMGTTLLARAAGAPEPSFGVGSAAAHRSGGAIEISALVRDDLRCDVDTAADLEAVVRLGVGVATRAVLADRTPRHP